MKKLTYIICFFILCITSYYAFDYGYRYAIDNFSDDNYRSREEISEKNPVMWESLYGESSTDSLTDSTEGSSNSDILKNEKDIPENSGLAVSNRHHILWNGYLKPGGYYLISRGDFVFLCREDKHTIYMDMGISPKDFPENWQEELKSGVYFSSLNDAYRVVEMIRHS